MNNINSIQNSEEITLYDLLEVLVRRKVVVFSVLLTIVGIAIIHVVTATPEYQVQGRIELGMVGNILPGSDGKYSFPVKGFSLEDPADIARKNEGKYGINLSSHKKEDGILFLSKTTTKPQEAVESIENLAREIFLKHQEYYNNILKLASEYTKELNSQLGMIDIQLLQLDKLKKKITDKSMISFLSEERSLKIRKVELQKELIRMAMFIKSGRKPYVSKPILPTEPVYPKTKPVIVISIVLGLVLGIISAYSFEFISKIKSRN